MSVSDHLWRYRFLIRLHGAYLPESHSRPTAYRGCHRRPWRPFGAGQPAGGALTGPALIDHSSRSAR
jgi:hypothetical protein